MEPARDDHSRVSVFWFGAGSGNMTSAQTPASAQDNDNQRCKQASWTCDSAAPRSNEGTRRSVSGKPDLNTSKPVPSLAHLSSSCWSRASPAPLTIPESDSRS
eukprot:1422381-Rhodomonas_salina.1